MPKLTNKTLFKSCIQCNKEICIKLTRDIQRKKFCSKICHNLYQTTEIKLIKNCQECSKEYKVYRYRQDSKFCCKSCYKNHKIKFGRKAQIKQLIESKHSPKQIAELLNLKEVTIYSILNQINYRRVYNATSYTSIANKLKFNKSCEICQENRVVDACHIIPAREGGPLESWNILILCPTHHRLFDLDKLSLLEKEKIQERVDGAIQVKIAV